VAHQLADKGIRAIAVSPGSTYFEGGAWANIGQSLPDLFATAMALNPTGRMGTLEEIVRSAFFVSSPASSRTSSANIRHRWSVVAGCAALIVDS
jgi:NAD(P)-dependent dehydrogenase (short-subunit alcohol dehydrogenase family)